MNRSRSRRGHEGGNVKVTSSKMWKYLSLLNAIQVKYGAILENVGLGIDFFGVGVSGVGFFGGDKIN